jgi:HlyD family secretion protein
MSGAAFGPSGLLVCALVLLVGCREAGEAGAAKEDKPASAGRASAAKSVQLVRASRVTMDDQIEIAGTLAAQEEVTVRSKVAGRLASIAVDLGSVVRAGEPIAQIEPIDYRLRVDQALAALAQAKALLGLSADDEHTDVLVDDTTGVRQARATLEEARSNFERSQQLLEKKMIAQADFDAARASLLRGESEVQRAREEVYNRLALLKQRKAELALARQQLADTTIRSPLAGVVQMRGTTAGEFLAQGAAVATIVSIDPLRLRVEVPEREAARVLVGQSVQVRLDESENVYTGKVARLSPMLNRQNRTLVVEAELANPGTLRPGSFARAVIALGASEPVLAVPSSALVVFAGIEKVIVVEAGKAVEKRVETGRRARGLVEVLDGLEPDQAVVREPGTLQQGQPVSVANEAASENAGLKPRENDTSVQ